MTSKNQKLIRLLWWMIFILIMWLATGCNPTPEIPDPKKVPTGKGKIYGELNERKMMCRIVKVIPHPELEDGYQCVYKHPKSDVYDRVTVGEHTMCPNNIYCDKR